MATIMTTTMAEAATPSDVLKLAAWLSPAFPVGAYTYSSGLEYAIEEQLVTDAASLAIWLEDMLRFGAGGVEGGLFALGHRAAAAGDLAALGEVARLGEALRPTAELALESEAQGGAFLKTVLAAWPHPQLASHAEMLAKDGTRAGYAVAVGATCGCHRLPLEAALAAFLHAVAANLVSAAVRAIPLGQTDGQRVTARLEGVIEELVPEVARLELDELGSATAMVDWASMRHETQYTRLFRS